jgi:hypothetical protein
MKDFDYFAFLNNENENYSKLVTEAKNLGVDHGIFQY